MARDYYETSRRESIWITLCAPWVQDLHFHHASTFSPVVVSWYHGPSDVIILVRYSWLRSSRIWLPEQSSNINRSSFKLENNHSVHSSLPGRLKVETEK